MKNKPLMLLATACITYLSLVAVPYANGQTDELAKSIEKGKAIYPVKCGYCHQPTGLGMEGVFPPLAKSDYLMKDAKRVVGHIKNGLEGEIVVNGKTYNGVMPAQDLTDEEIMHLLNYVRNSWGNKGKMVTLAEVKAVPKKK